MPYVTGPQRYFRTLDGYMPVADARRTNPKPAQNLAALARTDESRLAETVERARRAEDGIADRRRVNQRILRKPVLFDSRSGVDRRQRNQREGDIVEHISVLV